MYSDEDWEATMWDRYCDEEDDYFESLREESMEEEDEVIEDPYPEIFEEEAPPINEEVIVDNWDNNIAECNKKRDQLDEEEQELILIFRSMSRREKTMLMAKMYEFEDRKERGLRV